MYFITVIKSKDKKVSDKRCVGYYDNYETAAKAVIENWCDIWEYYYDYCIIENIEEGLYSIRQEQFWFKFNINTRKYEHCDVPDFAKGYINWALG
jgi:hypothetical protein